MSNMMLTPVKRIEIGCQVCRCFRICIEYIWHVVLLLPTTILVFSCCCLLFHHSSAITISTPHNSESDDAPTIYVLHTNSFLLRTFFLLLLFYGRRYRITIPITFWVSYNLFPYFGGDTYIFIVTIMNNVTG